jgi:hypothetical protein
VIQIDKYEDFIRENLEFIEVEDEGEADREMSFTAEQIRGLASKAHMLSEDVWDMIIDEEPTLRRLDKEIRAHDAASGGLLRIMGKMGKSDIPLMAAGRDCGDSRTGGSTILDDAWL